MDVIWAPDAVTVDNYKRVCGLCGAWKDRHHLRHVIIECKSLVEADTIYRRNLDQNKYLNMEWESGHVEREEARRLEEEKREEEKKNKNEKFYEVYRESKDMVLRRSDCGFIYPPCNCEFSSSPSFVEWNTEFKQETCQVLEPLLDVEMPPTINSTMGSLIHIVGGDKESTFKTKRSYTFLINESTVSDKNPCEHIITIQDKDKNDLLYRSYLKIDLGFLNGFNFDSIFPLGIMEFIDTVDVVFNGLRYIKLTGLQLKTHMDFLNPEHCSWKGTCLLPLPSLPGENSVFMYYRPNYHITLKSPTIPVPFFVVQQKIHKLQGTTLCRDVEQMIYRYCGTSVVPKLSIETRGFVADVAEFTYLKTIHAEYPISTFSNLWELTKVDTTLSGASIPIRNFVNMMHVVCVHPTRHYNQRFYSKSLDKSPIKCMVLKIHGNAVKFDMTSPITAGLKTSSDIYMYTHIFQRPFYFQTPVNLFMAGDVLLSQISSIYNGWHLREMELKIEWNEWVPKGTKALVWTTNTNVVKYQYGMGIALKYNI